MEDIASLKTITRGAGIIFLSLILSKILSFVYRLFIVHFYTVDDYGLFSEGLAIITLLKTFAVLGLVTAMVRYTSFYNARKDHVGLRAVLLTSLKYTIPLSVILACVLYVSADYLEVVVFAETGLADFLRVFALSLPFFSVSLLFAYFFMGLKLIKYNIYIQEIIPNLLKFVLVASFWFFGLGTIGIPLSWTVSFFLVILFSLVLLKRAFPSLHNIDGKRSLDKTLLIFSLPVFFGDIVITLMHWTGTLALGISETAEVVGIYNAALPTAELLLLVPVSFSALFMSVITEYYSLKKFGEVEKINRIVNKWIFLIGLALFLPLAIFSQQILGALFGFDYIIGSVAMSILAIGFIVNSLEYTSIGILAAVEKTRYIITSNVFALLTILSLSFVLVPQCGLLGAAAATAAAFIVRASISIYVVHRLNGMGPFSLPMLKALFAGLFSISLVYTAYKLLFFAGAPLWVFAVFFAMFCLLYGGLLLMLRCFEREDIEILKSVKKKTGLDLILLTKIMKKFT